MICLLMAGGYAVLNYHLYEQGFASNILIYLGEKALLTYNGNPPRLENMGFANPPFPHFFTLIIRDPFAATALVGGIIATALLMAIYGAYQKKKISLVLFVLLFFYVTLSPLSVYLLSQQMPTALLMGLLILIYHHLYHYTQGFISYHLFMFGLLSALVFLTEFQAAVLIFLFTLSLVCKVLEEKPGMVFPIVFTSLFPATFIAGSWCYLNWVFLGDPFHFISYWRSALEPLFSFPERMIYSQTAAGSLLASLQLCYENSFLLLPYYLFIARMLISPQFLRQFECVTYAVLFAPFMLLYIQMDTNYLELDPYFFLIFVVSAVYVRIHLYHQLKDGFFSFLFTLTVAVSLVMSFWLAFNPSSWDEKKFTGLLVGSDTRGNLENYQKLIDALEPDGKILLDDTVNFPLVFMVKEPKRFVLPYEYEFDMVLAFPAQFVRYLVVSDQTTTDAVKGRYPFATSGYVPDFTMVGQFGNLFLYEVTTPTNHSSATQSFPKNNIINFHN